MSNLRKAGERMTECYECAKLAELVAENSQLRAKVDELTKQIKLVDIGICSTCKFAGIHDGKRWPGHEFKGRMYCTAWSDGYMAEWTKPDGFCHMWKPKEGNE